MDEAVDVSLSNHNEYFSIMQLKAIATSTIHYTNLSNECSTPERMHREFCRNSTMEHKQPRPKLEYFLVIVGTADVVW